MCWKTNGRCRGSTFGLCGIVFQTSFAIRKPQWSGIPSPRWLLALYIFTYAYRLSTSFLGLVACSLREGSRWMWDPPIHRAGRDSLHSQRSNAGEADEG